MRARLLFGRFLLHGGRIFELIENAIVLEFAAQMALAGIALASNVKPIPAYLLDKHFLRKHGPKAYYGQPKT